ncbi:phosphoenolpyruvate--protein phosphotransferase [Candidatus Parabeggiatoa sp. HSG14]|uniref:phosphoenolpyruvate--protein phosphotransferase n=1 Tax=Candidatus Parabeggiatoa sp. HSG14 TaxID=3055593 RepID=UPI0025A7F4E6|nr:phosphoenolpyruvate--protein phosphotransferase [Thiotrichales bacterium HSG14]
MSLALHGIGVSKGIAIGRVHIIHREPVEINEYCLPEQHIEDEVARFENALAIAREQLLHISTRIPKDTTVDIATLIDAHLLMLDDSLLTKVPIDLIYKHQCNAEWALKMQCDTIVQIFEKMSDPYLSARKNDVEQVVTRIQRILHGYTDIPYEPTEALANTIVLADDLSPADTVFMQHHGILAFATEFGGSTSHTAILARSLGIPAIVGLRRIRPYIQPDDLLIVDGFQGVILVTPNERSLRYYRMRQREQKRYRVTLGKLKTTPTITIDGTPITLHANIEFPEDMIAVKRAGGEGVGLYRTEFLFMNRQQPPDEEEHFDAYRRVIQSLKGGPVTIRTLDLGADKQIVDSRHEGPLATNPALGLRAIRLCLKDQKLFKPQLRAILRASALGKVRMMIPMVCGFQELVQIDNIIKEIRDELQSKSQTFDPDMPFGVMVEVPAMAICSDLVTPHVDFLSIGTNDLIQYTLAIDRGDEAVNYLYDPLHPAVLRLIKMSIDAANKTGKPISMCGEMASDSRYIRLLLGLGLRSFSVNPEDFLEIKRVINNSNMNGLEPLAHQILEMSSQIEIINLLETINA